MSQFKKPALSQGDLVKVLQSRGLPLATTEDLQAAYGALKTIGYFRLTGFMLPFQITAGWKKHTFKPGATIHQILALYAFDTAIRIHCLEALEQIEVAIRTSICDHLARQYGAHWQSNSSAFKPGLHTTSFEAFAKAAEFDLNANAPNTKQSGTHLFLDSYYKNYTSPRMPPCWMIRECATFRTWAIAFRDLTSPHQKQIADAWPYPSGKRIDHSILEDWLHSLSILRNRCAHHSRITGRAFPFPPKATGEASVCALFLPQTNNLRTLLVVTAILLRSTNPRSNWLRRLSFIFDTASNVDIEAATGIENTIARPWTADPLWSFA